MLQTFSGAFAHQSLMLGCGHAHSNAKLGSFELPVPLVACMKDSLVSLQKESFFEGALVMGCQVRKGWQPLQVILGA